MNAALGELVIEGVDINRERQMEILVNDEFVGGNYKTDFMLKYYK